jgi:hypothetical protein
MGISRRWGAPGHCIRLFLAQGGERAGAGTHVELHGSRR